MRIIAGEARGRQIIAPEGRNTRPTLDRVRENIFNMLQAEVPGSRVLDLFAGSGQLGIEALSRGAESAAFVDNSDVSLSVVRKNLQGTDFEDKARIFKSDYKSFLSGRSREFDIAFLDPPYNKGILGDALISVAPAMSDYGIIICEHPKEEKMPESVLDFKIYREYKFGKITVTVYKKGDS